MRHKPISSARAPFAGSGVLALLVLLAGCSVSPLAKHTAAFSSVTNLVVDNSENAYRAAVRLHDQEQMNAAVAKYDTDPTWDPHKIQIKHLIDDQGLAVRTQVLDGLKLYAQSLSDLTNSVSSDRLDAAARSVGTSLMSLSGNISNATSGGFTVSQTQANLVSTALNALGQYLAANKVKSQVPTIIKNMDPNVETICQLLNDDITILRRQSHNDYEQLLTQQDSFIRHAQGLSPVERRAEINKLPQILAAQQTTDDMLSDLQGTLGKLALTHHALAAAAQNNNPESLRDRIAELEAAAQRLSKFYSSLPGS
jgi:hypothetical protein